MMADRAEEATRIFHDLVSGVDYPMFIVTAAVPAPAGGERDGCLVGFATQASIDPPRLVVMLSKANRTFRIASGSAELVVHFLHRGNHDLASLFGAKTGDQVDKLAACEWRRVEGVVPPVLTGTRGWIAGSILQRMDCGDHVAHLIDVTAGGVDADVGGGNDRNGGDGVGGAGSQLSFQAVKDIEPGHPA